MDFWLSYATLAAIYVLLGLSTNLLVGIAASSRSRRRRCSGSAPTSSRIS
jgi:hypothetical protein